MATYAVETAKHATTVAATVDTITFSASGSGFRARNRDVADTLYLRFDGVDPAVAADNSYFVGSGENLNVDGFVTEVRVISSGACDYSVEIY